MHRNASQNQCDEVRMVFMATDKESTFSKKGTKRIVTI